MSRTFARAYFGSDAAYLQRASPAEILGELVANHHFAVDQLQRVAWQEEIEHLQTLAVRLPNSFIFFEFAIPRMGKRVDAVILLNGIVFVTEYKVGADQYHRHAIDQVLDYALDLKNFHEGSHERPIVPILVATAAPSTPLRIDVWADDVVQPILANRETLLLAIEGCCENLRSTEIDPLDWAASRYKPTPTIVEAAQALYQGHDVHEISRSEAGAENLSLTAAYITEVIEDAKLNRKKAICFVTGVPGSGKTLAGLNVANGRMRAHEDEHAVFLSGNGPLVAVLREALAIDEVERGKVGENKKVSKKEALRHASAFIQNIHHFRDDHVNTINAPIELVAVFDEAQRAWTKDQASRFMREKRQQHDFDMSEPQFLLSVMDRHEDWCVVVGLIGGGQEINTGEAGLEEWFSAVYHYYYDWQVHISDRLTHSDFLNGRDVEDWLGKLQVAKTRALHLAVSVRSFRAEAVSDFVGAIIDGEANRARGVLGRLAHYPLAITRDVAAARKWLRAHARGTERIGLVASSNAIRLKPVGIHVKAAIDPAKWFLGDKTDIRSSYALEDAATEFEIQGLELDWVGVCWDANFRRTKGNWASHYFRGTRWERISDPVRTVYLANAYRVLLTRARQGMVIFVPEGDTIDDTRNPAFYDETYAFLLECGICPVDGNSKNNL